MRRYGWKKDARDQEHRDKLCGLPRRRRFPSELDLRPAMPKNIYDQGETNSCVLQSAIALVQHDLIKRGEYEYIPSASFGYYNARMIEGTLGQDDGCQIRNGIKAIAKYGLCYNDEFPFEPKRINETPSQRCYEFAKTGLVTGYKKVMNDQLPASQRLLAIKTMLVDGFPIEFGFSVFEQFESEQMERTGILEMPGTKDQEIGRHAVVIVGYRDDWRRVILRNSYGLEWGMPAAPGHFTMPYDFLINPELASDFWIISAVSSEPRIAA